MTNQTDFIHTQELLIPGPEKLLPNQMPLNVPKRTDWILLDMTVQ